jgi:hypothetical protein
MPDYLLIIILIISSQKYIKILQYSNVYQVVECYLKKFHIDCFMLLFDRITNPF